MSIRLYQHAVGCPVYRLHGLNYTGRHQSAGQKGAVIAPNMIYIETLTPALQYFQCTRQHVGVFVR